MVGTRFADFLAAQWDGQLPASIKELGSDSNALLQALEARFFWQYSSQQSVYVSKNNVIKMSDDGDFDRTFIEPFKD